MHGKGVALLTLCAASLLASPLAAQTSGAEGATVYERETFAYPRFSRVDPFRSLIREGELGVRIDDLELRGIVYHDDPSLSVAVLTQKDSERRIQARIGERVGSIRVLSIQRESVDVVVEELGVARRETLRLEKSQTAEGAR